MKKGFLLFAVLLTFQLQAQNIELGLILGGTTYSGDLGANASRFSANKIHASGGLFGRYYFNDYFAARGGINFGKISGDDAKLGTNTLRNLSFQSRLIEFETVGEIHLPLQRILKMKRALSPYVFGGVALFNFNPEANYQGNLVALQPLGTEGQGIAGNPAPYKLWQVSIPFGAGVKMAINSNISVGMELGFRKTFTDYLDDVSGNYPDFIALSQQNGNLAAELSYRGDELPGAATDAFPSGTARGSTTYKDWYIMGGLTLTYMIKGKNEGTMHSKSLYCPTFD